MIVVGCPVYERGWVLNAWFDHLDCAVGQIVDEIQLVFAYTESSDDTYEILVERGSQIGPTLVLDGVSGDHSTERNWGQKSRIETMVALRNQLLGAVRELGPDYYFSLDSDILIPPDAITLLLSGIGEYHAVSPLAYLGTGSITNAFYLQSNGVRHRAKVYNDLAKVDVLCAAKFMNSDMVRLVDYKFHRQGEDIGWSENAKALNFNLGFDSRIKCKHVMEPAQLGKTDARVGF